MLPAYHGGRNRNTHRAIFFRLVWVDPLGAEQANAQVWVVGLPLYFCSQSWRIFFQYVACGEKAVAGLQNQLGKPQAIR